MPKVNCAMKMNIEPAELGKIAASLTESDASRFWFSFVDHLQNPRSEDNIIPKYAKALAPTFGGQRKKIFESLYFAIKYHEFNCSTSNSKK